MRVAILHNPRPRCPDPAMPDDAYEEYDGEDTIAAVADALAGLGVEPVPIVAGRRLPWCLEQGRFDFAFNMAEGEGRRCREAVPAAMCKLLGLPFAGSDALTLAVTLDKAIARRLVSPDVPVARGVLVSIEADERELASLPYPVLVKPNEEGSSKGIGNDSLCRDATSAAAQRLDGTGNPYVLDVNPNPELGPGVGICRAVQEAGWTWERFIRQQLEWA
jgi:D-alanine-D-alanine ligase